MKVTWPREPEEDDAVRAWVERYEEASRTRAVCRYVTTHGRELPDALVEYHDRATRAHENLPLA